MQCSKWMFCKRKRNMFQRKKVYNISEDIQFNIDDSYAIPLFQADSNEVSMIDKCSKTFCHVQA